AAFLLDVPGPAADVLRLLEPFSDQVVVANCVVAPIAFGAALAAAAMRNDCADRWFAEALRLSCRLNSPVLRARTEIAWIGAVHKSDGTVRGPEDLTAMHDDVRALCAHRAFPEPGPVDAVEEWSLP